MPEGHREKEAALPAIDRNADDWAVVFVSTVPSVSAAA